jgi:hypothetical protein
MAEAVAHTGAVRMVLSFVGATFTLEPFSRNPAKLKYQRAAHAASVAIEADRP